MSYGKKSNSNYNKKHNFNPSAFTVGFKSAFSRASQLEKDGWTVETDRGASTKSQVDSLITSLGSRYEAETIPIVTDGDGAFFIAYRPKKVTASSGGKNPAQNSNKQAFIDEITNMFGSDPVEESDAVFDADKVIGFASGNSASTFILVKEGQKALGQPLGKLNTKAVEYALKEKKTYLTFGFDTAYDADYLSVAIRVLGPNITIGKASQDAALFLGNAAGDLIFVAPITPTSNESHLVMPYADAVKNA